LKSASSCPLKKIYERSTSKTTKGTSTGSRNAGKYSLQREKRGKKIGASSESIYDHIVIVTGEEKRRRDSYLSDNRGRSRKEKGVAQESDRMTYRRVTFRSLNIADGIRRWFERISFIELLTLSRRWRSLVMTDPGRRTTSRT